MAGGNLAGAIFFGGRVRRLSSFGWLVDYLASALERGFRDGFN